MITDVENYLIEKAVEIFGNSYVNYVFENENGIQYGGSKGIITRYINDGDQNKFYFCFELYK